MAVLMLPHPPPPRPEVATTPRAPRWVVVGVLAATALIGLVTLVRTVTRPYPVETWQAGQFWLTYDNGFIRRGLPGQVLALVTGGYPAAWQITGAAVVLLVIGVGALAVLVVTVVRATAGPLRPTVAALLVASPFTFSLVTQDLGRYDPIGFAALVVVGVAAARLGPVPAMAVSGTAVLVAAASQEFLVAFVAPLALLVVARSLPRARTASRLAAGLAAVLPGALLGVWGLTADPPDRVLLALVAEANAVRPDITVTSEVNSIAALTQDLDDALANLAQIAPWVVPLLTVALGGCCLLTAGLVWHLTGRREPRLFWLLTAWHVVAALGLTTIAIDYRRWWALVFVAVVATIPLLRPGPGRATGGRHRAAPGRPGPPVGPAVLAVVLCLAVLGQLVPVGAAILLDPAAQTQIFLDPAG